jgi:hypothetical protein
LDHKVLRSARTFAENATKTLNYSQYAEWVKCLFNERGKENNS